MPTKKSKKICRTNINDQTQQREKVSEKGFNGAIDGLDKVQNQHQAVFNKLKLFDI